MCRKFSSKKKGYVEPSENNLPTKISQITVYVIVAILSTLTDIPLILVRANHTINQSMSYKIIEYPVILSTSYMDTLSVHC